MTDTAYAEAEIIWRLAIRLHSLTLVGYEGLTEHRKTFDQLRTPPQPGDLVFMWLIKPEDAGDAVGRFLRYQSVPHDRQIVIERWGRPGDAFSWSNAEMCLLEPIVGPAA